MKSPTDPSDITGKTIAATALVIEILLSGGGQDNVRHKAYVNVGEKTSQKYKYMKIQVVIPPPPKRVIVRVS